MISLKCDDVGNWPNTPIFISMMKLKHRNLFLPNQSVAPLIVYQYEIVFYMLGLMAMNLLL